MAELPPVEQVMFEFHFLQRARVQESSKLGIARTAAGLVKDGQSVMMDSGTTTLAVARELRDRRSVTVITTSLPIAAALQHAPGVEVLILGGVLRRGSPDLLGALTEQNLENLHADLAFIGADAIDLEGNVYNQCPEMARMLRRMAQATSAVYAVVDSSKIGKTALVRFGNASGWAGLITDPGITSAQSRSLKTAGLKLLMTPLNGAG